MALIPDDPKQRNALLLGVFTAALFFVFWSYWYSPRQAELTEKAAQLERLIPQSEEVAALLNEISAAARQSGVSDPEMRPEPNEVGAFYTKETYEIEVVGEFHDIGRFLTRIASLPRIITPKDLELVPYQGDESFLDPETEAPLTARLRIQTFILPDYADPAPIEGSGVEGGD